MTLQTQNNQISSTLSGFKTLKQNSENNTNKIVKHKNISNDYYCLSIALNEHSEALQPLYWCIYQYIINNFIVMAKLFFCLVELCRKCNSQLVGKYLQLVSVLVLNSSINFKNKTEVKANAK